MINKIFIAEFIGSCFLTMIIVGSGIMAESLTNDNAIMLLANAIATGAGLFVLITTFAEVSGAHFNPIVSLAMYFRKKIDKKDLVNYFSAQILGCLIGVGMANFFFDHQIYELSSKSRNGLPIFISEIIASIGLLLVIFGSLKSGKSIVAANVSFYITAGYWFTASTSFANPAVSISRAFTDSFTGIAFESLPFYLLAQFFGLFAAMFIIKKLFK
ncbi:MAG: aquaporin [Proteobacteria bacterium]|nr:aquaporin [Pseudomonadota bacterium]